MDTHHTDEITIELELSEYHQTYRDKIIADYRRVLDRATQRLGLVGLVEIEHAEMECDDE